MESFRVALFTGNYNHIRDGVSLTLNRLVRFLEDAGVEVLVFGPTVDQPALQHNGTLVPVPSISMPGRNEYRISLRLPRSARKRLEEFNPHIVHIATPDILGLLALRWAKQRGKIVVSSYHTHFTSYFKYYRMKFLEPSILAYLRWFYSHSLHVYVPTPSMIDNLKKNRVGNELKVWARGIDTSLFSPSRRDEAWRQRLGFAKDDIVVLFVSRLVWEKNLTIFAETIKNVSAGHPRMKALVVGDGPASDELKEMLPGAVYTGFLTGDDLARAYASSEIFFFPSDTESFGNVTLEAMSSGLPCLVADAVGSKSLVEQGVNGYLVKVPGADEFVSSLMELVTNKPLRDRMGRASVAKAGAYAWEQINSTLLLHYKEALNTNSQDS